MIDDKSVYWLLDTVVEHRLPIVWLYPDPGERRRGSQAYEGYFAVAFNRYSHGLARRDLLQLLYALFEDGTLLAWPPECGDFGRYEGGFAPTRRQVRDALNVTWTARSIENEPPERLHFGLSEKGGNLWEGFARPDWRQYVSKLEAEGASLAEAFDDEGDMTESSPEESVSRRLNVEMASINRPLIEGLLQNDLSTLGIVEPATAERKRLRPWDATYWKAFPQAYRIRYSLVPEEELARRGASISGYDELDTDYGRWGPNWYTDFITGSPKG